jgi:hypothetical protein
MGLAVTWRENRVGACLVATLATLHLPGDALHPKKSFTSDFDGEG